MVDVFLLDTVQGPPIPLPSIPIDVRSCDMLYITSVVGSLPSPVQGCTILDIHIVHSGKVKLFLSWTSLPPTVSTLETIGDTFHPLDSPHAANQFHAYVAQQRKKAFILVEMLTQAVRFLT